MERIKNKIVTFLNNCKRAYRMAFYPQKEINPQTSYAISVFNEGDVITRLEPGYGGDRSYMGDRLVFKGIKNNEIIFSHPILGKPCGVNIDGWQYGWGLYKEL